MVELYRQQFREGHRTVFDLLESEQTLSTARASQITNRIAMHAAEYRVLQKLGGLFRWFRTPLAARSAKARPKVLEAADARGGACSDPRPRANP